MEGFLDVEKRQGLALPAQFDADPVIGLKQQPGDAEIAGCRGGRAETAQKEPHPRILRKGPVIRSGDRRGGVVRGH